MALAWEPDLETRRNAYFLVMQDVKCLHCGSLVGQLIGEPGASVSQRAFRPGGNCAGTTPVVSGRVRCCRCGGPVYLDEMESVVRVREEDLKPPRRGRKPKSLRPA